ncbi:TPA: hypothetical protein ACH3X1_000010 [Trebouxia sp. C0004]
MFRYSFLGPLAVLLNVAYCLLGLLHTHPVTAAITDSKRFFQGTWHNRTGTVSLQEHNALRDEASEMFAFGYDHYLLHAFPKDELRPISCTGHDSQGGVALTLIDALDSLVVMNSPAKLRGAVQWLCQSLTLDVDARVHVFEVTIRALGGLLSTHVMLERRPSAVPGYNGCLLRLAVDLANRLLPAFDTASGIPLSWVHLQKGVLPGETRFTCTACAATLLLEFGTLSRLTGNQTHEEPSDRVVGNTLHTDNQEWLRKDSGIGAGIDSFYEYLLKAYLVFGEVEYLDMFSKVYTSAMHGLRLKLLASAPPDSPSPPPWLADAEMDTGKLAQPWISSLSAFWPGLQALAGQVEDAKKLLAGWVYVWTQFDGLPDLFDMAASQRHPLQKGYPLRPELMESTYLLYAATRDPTLLEVGRTIQATLAEGNKQKCGYAAAVADVSTGELEDSMESFFLSETSKYLYLLQADAADLPDHYIFTTEGHLLPPFQLANSQQPSANITMQSASSSYWDWWIPNFGNWLPHTAPADDVGRLDVAIDISETASEAAALQCAQMCRNISAAEASERQHLLQSVLPLMPLTAHDAILLRQRRCTACLQVSASMVQSATSPLSVGTVDDLQKCSASTDGICPADIVQTQAELTERRFVCLLEVQQDKLQCSQYQEIKLAAELPSLPNNALVLQQRPTQASQTTLYSLSYLGSENLHLAVGATFGQSLQEAGRCGQAGLGDSMCNLLGVVVIAEPADACGPLTNAQELSEAVLLVDRGSCSFMQKALNVEQAGALGVIVVNNKDSEAAFAMGSDEQPHSVKILTMMVSKHVGQDLRCPKDSSQGGSEPRLLNMDLVDLSNASLGSAQSAYMEQHVYVPEATQSWLENNGDVTRLAQQDKSKSTWQSLVLDLVASNQSMQT